MAEHISNAAQERRPAMTVTGVAQLTVNPGVIALTVALANADTVALMKLPAGHIPVDLIVDTDALDSGSAIVFDAGLLEDGADGDELISASDAAQAGGVARLNQSAGRRLEPVDHDRLIGITVTTAPTGGQAGTINATLLSRAAGIDD